MTEQIYEIVAQGARYWFLFLMALIVWRSWRWYRKDRKQAKKRMKLLPDAGFVGEMVVISAGALPRGTALPLPREGTLGASRTNDLCVQADGVDRRHLWFRYDEDKGLLVEPFGKNAVSVDGEAFQSRKTPLYMAHGSYLEAGGAQLRLRLFAGFESTGHAPRRPGVEDEAPQPQPDAQQLAYQQWLMQQQWMMQQAYQQGYQQAMAQQEDEYPDAEDDLPAGEADVYAYEEARAQGLVDDSAFMRPAGVARPQLPVYDEPEAPVVQPVQTEEEAQPEPDADDWTYDEVYDEDMTDAAAPPRSAYVGRDEAERAKRQVWDRYFGGGVR